MTDVVDHEIDVDIHVFEYQNFNDGTWNIEEGCSPPCLTVYDQLIETRNLPRNVVTYVRKAVSEIKEFTHFFKFKYIGDTDVTAHGAIWMATELTDSFCYEDADAAGDGLVMYFLHQSTDRWVIYLRTFYCEPPAGGNCDNLPDGRKYEAWDGFVLNKEYWVKVTRVSDGNGLAVVSAEFYEDEYQSPPVKILTLKSKEEYPPGSGEWYILTPMIPFYYVNAMASKNQPYAEGFEIDYNVGNLVL